MNLQDKIKFLRIKQDMTQKELGQKLGISTVSIGHWEAGTRTPSSDAIVLLAKLFNVSADFLLGIEIDEDKDSALLTKNELSLLSNYRVLDKHGQKAVDTICMIEKARIESEQIKSATKPNVITLQPTASRYIPKYTTPSAAGYSVPLDGDDFEMILVDDNVPNDADFAVVIQGDSMYPYIHDGDTVYVKKDCELSVGDVGIFCINGAMYCKQYYIDDNKDIEFVSANPCLRNTNIHISADSNASIRCYGKVLLDFRIELPDYIFE